MFKNNKVVKIWLIFILFLSILLLVEINSYFSISKQDKSQAVKNLVNLSINYQLAQQKEIIQKLEESLQLKDTELIKTKNTLDSLKEQEKIKGEKQEKYPFSVPTNGITATYNGTFGGNMYGKRHLGIDIWTTLKNNGMLPNHKGNAVYSACDGFVESIQPANGAIVIKCDDIDENYKVPKHSGLYTYYGHMGNAETKELFIEVEARQRVRKGDFLGYQGDLSQYFPEMRNVHLHFSVFTGLSETDPKGGALNPCLYIGGNCMQIGEKFKVTKKG